MTRHCCDIPAHIQSQDGQRSICGLVTDINELGLRFSSGHWLTGKHKPEWVDGLLQERVIVEFQAPAIGKQCFDTTVTALAVAEWRDGQEVGLRIIAMMPYARARLRRVIAELKEGTRR
jgi:hypothetical protein